LQIARLLIQLEEILAEKLGRHAQTQLACFEEDEEFYLVEELYYECLKMSLIIGKRFQL